MGANCCQGDIDSLGKYELRNATVRKFNKAELEEQKIMIGDGLYESPLARRALLAENFSHIYGDKFGEENKNILVKLQSRMRCWLMRRRFQTHIERQKAYYQEQPQTYFSQEENRETLTQQTHTMSDLKQKLGEDKEPYTYQCSGATYTGQWLGGMRHG